MDKESVAVVMPAYNEANSIEETVNGIIEILESEGIENRIIVSEDGSTDGTKKVLERLEDEGKITAATGDERRGYTGALKKGVEQVESDYVLFMDGDGQYYPEDFLDLWKKRDEAEAVIGRRDDRADSFDRRLISNTFQLVVEKTVASPDLKDMTSSFRLVEESVAKEVIPEIEHMRDSSWTEFGVRAHNKGYEQLEVPVRHRERQGEGDTRIYHFTNLPAVVFRQLIGLWKLRKELKKK